MTKTTRTRPEVKRLLSIAKPVDQAGHGLIRITMIAGRRVEVDCYGLTVFPAYDGSAVGVEVRNLIDQTTYHVCLATPPAASSCDCKGHARWHRCKHLDALRKMQERGQLPVPAAEEEPAEAVALDW